MNAQELVDRAFAEGLFSDKFHGATPHKTMHARLSVDIVKHGEASRFIRTKPGVYFLRALLERGVIVSETRSMLPGELPSEIRLSMYDAPRRRPPPAHERVLVLPNDAFARTVKFQGIRADEDAILLRRLLDLPGAKYIDRSAAEGDPHYNQVVTYILVVKRGAVLSFRRGTYSRAAAFLRGNRCIGFGGHVTERDVSLFSRHDAGIGASAWRELHEEVALIGVNRQAPSREESHRRPRLLGILNDNSSLVGQRHVAVVFEYDVDGDPAWETVRRGEAAVNQLRWVDVAESANSLDLNEYEYWSQLCWRKFFPGLVKGQPRFKIIDAAPFAVEPWHIVAVVGSIGSGKSVATQILAEQFGYGVVSSGRVLAGLMGVPPIPETPRGDFQALASVFIRGADGPRRLAKALLHEADRLGGRKIAIDGIRQHSTLRELKILASSSDPGGRRRAVATLFIHAAPDVAYRFYRRREAARITTEEFMSLYAATVEAEVPFLISDADAILYNWSGRTAYGRAVRDLMRMVRKAASRRGWKRGLHNAHA